MLARRTKIHMGSQIVAETPLLLPSFSSKGFPEVGKIMKLMAEFITSPILISAYDIHYKYVPQKITFSELIFLDSGGYEARYEHDLSETYGKVHRSKPWNRRYHERVLKNWSSKWPTVAVTYDSPVVFQKFAEQVRAASESKAKHPSCLWELLLKPETKKDKFVGVEKVIKHVDQLREFAVIGMTEKEIDDSLFGTMQKIARLRSAMDAADVHTPIHIFGSLDPLTSVLYFVAGAEIFDGLTWLRFGYHEGRTLYSQNYAAIHDPEGIRRKSVDQSYELWKNNYYYLERLRTQMVNHIRTGEYAHFGAVASIVEDAYKQLEAVTTQTR
jgi:hypothetical protein